jgi:hypothetical protein
VELEARLAARDREAQHLTAQLEAAAFEAASTKVRRGRYGVTHRFVGLLVAVDRGRARTHRSGKLVPDCWSIALTTPPSH